MKKFRIFVFLALNILLLTNCNKDEKKVENNEVVTINENDKRENSTIQSEEDTNFKFSDETYKNLEIFSKNKEKVIEKLKNLDKEEADKLYDEYHKENQKFCEKLMQEEPFFYDFVEYGSSDTKEKFLELRKFFNKYGLTILSTQGGFLLHIPSSYYYNIFKDYVSDEYRDYLELTFKDDDIDVGNMPTGLAFFEDNGITPLTIQEVEKKILLFRNFIDKYPDTKFKEIFAVYVFYILDYIEFSLSYRENEEGIEIPEDYYKISEENMKEYTNFVEEYPNELASECLRYLLKNYKSKKSDVIEENIIKIIKMRMKEEFNVTELWNL